MSRVRLLAIAAAAALVAGCSSMPEVHRIAPDQVTDVSGYWNDTDANLTAQQMISQMLGDPWLSKYRSAHAGHDPIVIVGDVRNLSSEHIAVGTFINDM
ncbi:MAG TPA: penicillin-binding protein activator LpoB, partial [Gammaproteobacteria bacterium]|nr:penicillin-binding protein activator LpoB [Gammaproteobacteria bacterium]